MYHCPDCSTILNAAAGATRSETEPGALKLNTLHYNCPGCGQHFLYRKKDYADREPTGEWYHLIGGEKMLLMHHPPEF
jgi:DNA-directed RNA polymerase subunit RPC12/RpoP